MIQLFICLSNIVPLEKMRCNISTNTSEKIFSNEIFHRLVVFSYVIPSLTFFSGVHFVLS